MSKRMQSDGVMGVLMQAMNARASGMSSVVYFIQQGTMGPVKVGFSENLSNRLSSLQTGNPYELRVLLSHPGDEALEHTIHAHLHKHRLQGEWFQPCADIVEIVLALRSGIGPEEYLAAVNLDDTLANTGGKIRWQVAFRAIAGSKYLEPLLRRSIDSIALEFLAVLQGEETDMGAVHLLQKDAEALERVFAETGYQPASVSKLVAAVASANTARAMATRLLELDAGEHGLVTICAQARAYLAQGANAGGMPS